MNNYEWNTPYKELSENLQKIHDAADKMFSVKGNSKKWEKSNSDVRYEMINTYFNSLNMKGKLTEEELEYLTEINFHTLRAYLEKENV